MHVSVLLQAILEHLLPPGRDVNRCIDGTVGAGGHAAALLNGGAGALLGFDLDQAALALARTALAPYGDRAHLIHDSYAHMRVQAAAFGWAGVDAILLDLGVSSMQFDSPERGFSFRYDAPLDMRFDPTSSGLTAGDLVNQADEDELSHMFYQYGEDPNGRRLARAIIQARPLTTTGELAAVLEKAVPRRHHDKIHPATRAFQALRIAVNDELGTVERVLPEAIALLNPGGRLAVISFHSLEDRIVKDAFRLAATDCICPPEIPVCVCDHHASVRLITRKPLTAADDEIARNPRSRSAKLRVVEKLAPDED
ncbi:MAG: 16S rRNA (cytosine(1402)-N(4))-methyltransferase RsmH [bacterium]|nr:16S rRNA (cytosine(1402)-N(4))-methyltransferase RsmH [bacterium]